MSIIVNKILLITLIMACLNIFRHAYYLIQVWFRSTEETPIKYKLNNKSLFVLGLSISYLLASIISGLYI